MKLERLQLENFRQYHGRQRLSFARDAKRNVTVIHGINGAGKTSLFAAINWCLYGEGINKEIELVSKEAVDRAQAGEVVRTTVELSFQHEGERYIVRRQLTALKNKRGAAAVLGDSEFTMSRIRRDGQAEHPKNPISRMNSILPSNVRTYFLFDGEKIDNFAKPEASDEVRYAIYNVLKLEVLTRGRDHLEKAAAEYRRELKRISTGVLHDLVEREERLRTDKDKATARSVELEQEIESARRKISDMDKRLAKMQGARALQEQRELIERELKEREVERDQLVARIRELAMSGTIIIGQPAIEQALTILDQKRERGEIPSNIRQQFVQDLLDRLRCICGRDFDETGQEYRRLEALLKSSFPGSLEDEVLNTAGTLRSFAERDTRLREDLNEAMRRRAELNDHIKQLDEELSDVSQKLKDSPEEEISKLEKQRDDFRADVESYSSEQGGLEARLDTLDEEIEELGKQIRTAEKEQTTERLLTRKAELGQRAADAIGAIYETFADDMRRQIEAKTKEIFKLLIWKHTHFCRVQLGPDYNLEVIDRYGLPSRSDLSAGERQVMSLSFITAMSQISEEEAPLVMDTPFGRLSSHHRNSITKYLPELAPQLVLFVTDEELRDEARKNLNARVGAEYRLEFDQKTSCTEIIEVKK